MLLQTLVENAVKHGISQLRTPGRIDITASRHAGELTLEVRDTGPGLEAPRRSATSSGESFGLRSVRDRLEGHFGTHASLTLAREKDRTVARIRLPLIHELAGVAGASR
jgi:sensor histidine kinase YesM